MFTVECLQLEVGCKLLKVFCRERLSSAFVFRGLHCVSLNEVMKIKQLLFFVVIS
jgi:hypothetical protein